MAGPAAIEGLVALLREQGVTVTPTADTTAEELTALLRPQQPRDCMRVLSAVIGVPMAQLEGTKRPYEYHEVRTIDQSGAAAVKTVKNPLSGTTTVASVESLDDDVQLHSLTADR